MKTAEPPTAADRFALTLEGLCRAVAARIAPGWLGQAMASVMILMIWRRLRRIEGQVQALLARFRAGRLRVRPRAQGRVGVGRRAVTSPGLPRGFGWLLPLVPHEAACFASQMRGVLGEPEMVALLEAAPQARRVLRPLCRMLGIEASVLSPAGVSRGEVAAEVAAGESHGGSCTAPSFGRETCTGFVPATPALVRWGEAPDG